MFRPIPAVKHLRGSVENAGTQFRLGNGKVNSATCFTGKITADYGNSVNSDFADG